MCTFTLNTSFHCKIIIALNNKIHRCALLMHFGELGGKFFEVQHSNRFLRMEILFVEDK